MGICSHTCEPPGPQIVPHDYERLVECLCDSRGAAARLSSFFSMSCGLKAMLGSPATVVSHPPHSSSSPFPLRPHSQFCKQFCPSSLLSNLLFPSPIYETMKPIISIFGSHTTRLPHWNENPPFPKLHTIVIVGRE